MLHTMCICENIQILYFVDWKTKTKTKIQTNKNFKASKSSIEMGRSKFKYLLCDGIVECTFWYYFV